MLLAPIAMRKISLFMLDTDAQQAAMTLAAMAVMHPLESQAENERLAEFPAATYSKVYQDLKSRFDKISAYVKAPFVNITTTSGLVSLQQLQVMDEHLKGLWARVSEMEEMLRRQSEKTNALRQLSNSLQKFASLDLDLSRLRRRGKFLGIVVGTVPSANFSQLKRALSLASFLIKSFYSSEGIEHVVVFGSSLQQEEVHDLLKSADFRGLTIPEEFSGSPERLQADLDQQIGLLDSTRLEINRQLSVLMSEYMPALQKTRNLLILAKPYARLALVLRGRGSLVSLQGWVPARRCAEIRHQLETRLDFPFQLEFSEPVLGEYDSVPTLLKNSWLLTPFQNLVKNFGTPGYREVDPSGLFALSYILMFGMMFGDIGQGGVILLASALLRKRYPDFAIVAACVGLSSLIFGFAYGSLFGYENVVQALWMSPMHDPSRALWLAVIWGAGFLLVANLLAIRNDLASGLSERAIHSGNGMAGLFLYLAAFYAAYQLMLHNRFGWPEGMMLGLPMTAIMRFQWRQSSGQWWERVLVVIIEALEHVISNVSGTLSFLRVAAFSLNHIALAAAVFAIAGMMDQFGHTMTVVLGNLIIILLEGAIVAIQCLRLEYYEGFSRFFGGKGKAFEPLTIEF